MADKDTKFSKPDTVTTAIEAALTAEGLQISELTLVGNKPVADIVSEIFGKTKDRLGTRQRASITQSAITEMVAAVKQDYALKSWQHPLSSVRFEHALTKGLIQAIDIIGNQPEELRSSLIVAHKKSLPEVIKEDGFEELKHFVLPNDILNKENLDKFYAVLGCGDEKIYNDVLAGKEVVVEKEKPKALTNKDEIVNALAEALKKEVTGLDNPKKTAENAYSWVVKGGQSRATFTPEKIQAIAQKVEADYNQSKSKSHALGGNRFSYTLAKLMIENAEITGKKPENHRKELANKLKQRFRETILGDKNKKQDERFFHPNLADVMCEQKKNFVTGAYWTVNEQKLDALYNALGQADPKKFADLIKVVPVTLVDKLGYAVTPANIAKLAYQKALNYDSLKSPVPITEAGLQGAVTELFQKLPKGTSAKLKPEDIEAAVAALSINQSVEFQIDENKTVHGSLGTGGRLYVFEKLLIEELTIDPANRAAEAKEALTNDLKRRIKADILREGIDSLKKEDFPGLVTGNKRNKIDVEKFDAFFETIGGEDVAQGWQIAQSGKSEGIENTDPVGNEKTGFAAASTGTKLGIVGSAALGTFLLATSGEKEDPGKQTEPGKEPEKSAGWRPNFKAFLGIAALLGAAVWTWTVLSQKGKGGTNLGKV